MPVRGTTRRAPRLAWWENPVLLAKQKKADERRAVSPREEVPATPVTAGVKTMTAAVKAVSSTRTKNGYWTSGARASKVQSAVTRLRSHLAGAQARLVSAEEGLKALKASFIRADRSDVSILKVGEVVPTRIQEVIVDLLSFRGEKLLKAASHVEELRGAVCLAERRLAEGLKALGTVSAQADRVREVHKAQQAKWTKQAKAVYAYLLERGVVNE